MSQLRQAFMSGFMQPYRDIAVSIRWVRRLVLRLSSGYAKALDPKSGASGS